MDNHDFLLCAICSGTFYKNRIRILRCDKLIKCIKCSEKFQEHYVTSNAHICIFNLSRYESNLCLKCFESTFFHPNGRKYECSSFLLFQRNDDKVIDNREIQRSQIQYPPQVSKPIDTYFKDFASVTNSAISRAPVQRKDVSCQYLQAEDANSCLSLDDQIVSDEFLEEGVDSKPIELDISPRNFQNRNFETTLTLGTINQERNTSDSDRNDTSGIFFLDSNPEDLNSVSTNALQAMSEIEGAVSDRRSSIRNNYYCPICEQNFISKTLKKAHDSEHHKGPQKCRKCDAVLKSKENLIRHLMTHSHKSTYECQICKGRFQSSSTLAMHMGQTHNMSKKKVQKRKIAERKLDRIRIAGQSRSSTHRLKTTPRCIICSRLFSMKRSVARHIRIVHKQEKNFVCARCQKTFSTKHNLNLHISKTHKKMTET